MKESRFKVGNDLKFDEKKRQTDALNTSLSLQEQLIADLTYQNEIAYDKNQEYHSVISNNQNKVIRFAFICYK
jgi:hypothetical protein